jgi:hypothetical protein
MAIQSLAAYVLVVTALSGVSACARPDDRRHGFKPPFVRPLIAA